MRPLTLLFFALAACSTDTFAAGGDAADAGDALADARDAPDGSVCSSETSALFCDDFERTAVLGSWASATEGASGDLSLVSGWTGKALRAHSSGAGAKSALSVAVGGLSSYTFRAVVEVMVAPPSGAILATLGIAGEMVELLAYGSTMTLHVGGTVDLSANLGNVSGRHLIGITRDVGAKVLRATVDGAVRGTIPLSAAASGVLSVTVGVVDPGQADAETEVRIDDVVVGP